ncbi:alpha/beta hydrolase, partial [Cadophora sp. DSE1049]
HCLVQGPAQGPVILFSNSLSTTLQSWDSFVQRFSSQPGFSQYRIVRYDHRGHGESPAESDEPCTFELLAEDVALMLEYLQIPRLYAFVGVSMGAATAVYFAAQYPERVERIVVADVLTHGPSDPATDPFAQRITLAKTDGGRPLMEESLRRWFPYPNFLESCPDVRERIKQQILSTSIRGFSNAVRALQKFDLRPLLPKLNGRQTLIVVGELDGPLPTTMKQISDAVPGSQYVLIKRAGHLSFIDGENQFLRAVSRFL